MPMKKLANGWKGPFSVSRDGYLDIRAEQPAFKVGEHYVVTAPDECSQKHGVRTGDVAKCIKLESTADATLKAWFTIPGLGGKHKDGRVMLLASEVLNEAKSCYSIDAIDLDAQIAVDYKTALLVAGNTYRVTNPDRHSKDCGLREGDTVKCLQTRFTATPDEVGIFRSPTKNNEWSCNNDGTFALFPHEVMLLLPDEELADIDETNALRVRVAELEQELIQAHTEHGKTLREYQFDLIEGIGLEAQIEAYKKLIRERGECND